MKRLDIGILLATMLMASLDTAAQPAAPAADRSAARRFDGVWDTTVSCPDVKEKGRLVKGYMLQFPVGIENGMLRGEHGAQNVSGWLSLEGRIEPDGSALLMARGLTGDPDFTLDRLQSGSPYAYSVKAHFDESRASGKRVELRPCELTFVKR
jgi:hypothetical protein